MFYAALVSLANTIDRRLNHNLFSIPFEDKQRIISLCEYVTPFQAFLEKFPDKFTSIEGRMREVANDAEDIIEYLVLEKVFSSSDDKSGCHASGKHELQLEKVIEEIDLIAGEVKKIQDTSSSKDVQQRGADSSFLSSSSSGAPAICKEALVGFEDYVIKLKERLCGEPSKLHVIPICGMGGIGKTTLAKNIYDDPLVVENFVIHVWVTISQDYSAQRILSSLLESMKEFLKEFKLNELEKLTDEEKVYKILMGRKYLVVLDDMWSSNAWDVVRKVFPDDGNGSRILLTTRLSDVASYPDPSSKLHEMHLMDADQSWDLLKQKVFEGLLSTVSKNPASWHEIAENVKSVETADQEQIEEILSLSYAHLPQYLRPYFLYMGSFPEDEEIRVVKLIRLWVAEGFMKPPIDSESFEKVGEDCLEELVKRNLVLVTKGKCDGSRIKSCSLHDLMRDLCIRKAHETKLFLNLMEKHIEKESFTESMQNQRRVNVDSSNLMHLSSLPGSSIHSIKCLRYEYVVKLDLLKSVRLLRVLDMEPDDVKYSHLLDQLLFELFHSRYLAIRLPRKPFPSALWKLQNLQTLIIRDHMRWNGGDVYFTHWKGCMPQLRHVEIHSRLFFNNIPQGTTCDLQNLQTLSYLSHWSCTESILKMIPNLKKLKIDCSFGKSGDPHVACLSDLIHLQRLENLEIYADLNGIPNDIGEIPTLELIEVKGDAKMSLVESAEEIQKEQEDLDNNTLQVVCINAKTSRQFDSDEVRTRILYWS
ncbi:hypothetical protein C2S51_009037 [Perilla frutescens var. frutescens]|nr:hypothetical protein C2S51_009037 [Perilla frutescens var. frutescens]